MKKIRALNLCPVQYEVFEKWVYLTRVDGRGLNSERPRADLSTAALSLRIFCLGFKKNNSFQKSSEILAELSKSEEYVIECLKKGSVRRAETENRSKPSYALERKVKFSLLRLRDELLCDEFIQSGGIRPKSAIELVQEAPRKQVKNSKFLRENWPTKLKKEWSDYANYRSNPDYNGLGIENRKKLIRPSTVDGDQIAFNQIVGFCVRQEKMRTVTLLDLIDYERIIRYKEWYFSTREKGGYTSFRTFLVQAAVLSRYLCASGKLRDPLDSSKPYPYPPNDKDGRAIWTKIYKLVFTTQQQGSTAGKIVKNTHAHNMIPDDLVALGELAWSTKPLMSNSAKNLRVKESMKYIRKRAAMFFLLASFMPVRARNWREMQWEKNLRKKDDGEWEIYFAGSELKVEMRGKEQNVYHHHLPPEASIWIDRWQEELKFQMGKDFKKQTPYVFPQRNYRLEGESDFTWGICSYNGFRQSIHSVALEIRGHEFRPHQVRHIVATYLVQHGTIEYVKLAAELLGDTIDTIIDNYYKPDLRSMYDKYYANFSSNRLARKSEELNTSSAALATNKNMKPKERFVLG